MAKKSNNLLIYAAIAGGAYYYFVILKKKDQEKETAKEADEFAKEAAKPTTTKKAAPKPSAAEKAFVDKVRKLQTALGISPTTGFVGDKTKAALNNLKLTDSVTTSNIDDLIKKVELAKKQSSKPALSYADQVRMAFNKSKDAALIVTEYFDAKPKLLDKGTNTWKDSPGAGNRSFSKGKKLLKTDGYSIIASTTSNKVVLKNKAGEYFIIEPKFLLVQ